jgi:hypothetical protein
VQNEAGDYHIVGVARHRQRMGIPDRETNPRIGNPRGGGGEEIGGRIDPEDLARVGRFEDDLGQLPRAAADVQP